jgi:hypothetical protein
MTPSQAKSSVFRSQTGAMSSISGLDKVRFRSRVLGGNEPKD